VAFFIEKDETFFYSGFLRWFLTVVLGNEYKASLIVASIIQAAKLDRSHLTRLQFEITKILHLSAGEL
jgi:hypothetical protein